MATQYHCPYRQSTLLQQALAPNKMRIAFLLGAGCPVSIQHTVDGISKPLIPDIKGLTALVHSSMEVSEKCKSNYSTLLSRFKGADGGAESPTIEDILSHLRSLQDVVRNGNIDGLDKDALSQLDKEICGFTTTVVSQTLPEKGTAYHQFATWVGGIQRTHAIEIFTPNYDLLIEQALEEHKIPYFDGFIGTKNAFFDLSSMETDSLPSRWARLWKVHGSINWWRTKNNEVTRREIGLDDDRQMIYPSHLKYDQSRRMPYLAMLDRLRAFLARGQGVLVTCGYSFSDQHLNEVILHGLRSNPTAMCFGLLRSPKAKYTEAFTKAKVTPNLSLLAADGAILGTLEREWRPNVQSEHPLHDICISTVKSQTEDAQEIEKCKFLLGDFKHFGNFLAQQLSTPDDKAAETNAT